MPFPKGSDAWNGDSSYGGAYAARLQYVRDTMNERAITSIATTIRAGINCQMSPKYTAGNFNLVRKVMFDDGGSWVARIRMPSIDCFDEHGPVSNVPGREALNPTSSNKELQALESEIATMTYIRSVTRIPIPQVYAWECSNDNDVGFPYVLMEYVHGTPAIELAGKYGNRLTIPPRVQHRYFEQLATIMVSLAQVRFASIGSIVKITESGTDTYNIGPIAEVDDGLYPDAEQFYRSYPVALARTLYGDDWSRSGGSQLIKALPDLAEAISQNESKSPSSGNDTTFGLANLELGTNNVLVDESFNIVGVIDWDSTIAAPRAVLHQFPWGTGADPGIPGLGAISFFGSWKGREEATRLFASILEERARNVSNPPLFTEDEFFGQGALTFRALAYFRVRQDWVDRELMPGILWMQKQSRQELLRYYGISSTS